MGFVVIGIVFVIGIVGYNKLFAGYGESDVVMHNVSYNHFGR